MIATTVHHLQIERVVLTSFRGKRARFVYLKDDIDLCHASCYTGDTPLITPCSAMLTIEQASALSIAISMAIDWIAEQRT